MILKAAWVVPVAGLPVRDGAVRIEGVRITAVGSLGEVAVQGEAVRDLGAVVLTPGLVNPHTHLELTCYAGRLGPGPFWEWLPKLVALRREAGQEARETQGVIDGAWQSVRAGVTCVGDISRRNLHWRVLKELPLRKVCFVELLSLADHPPRDPEELRAAVAEVSEDGLLTAGVTPHTPYTVKGEHLRAALRFADELGRPWSTHWAETREERAFLEGQRGVFPAYVEELLAQCEVHAPGESAIDYLERCVAGVRPGALAHYNYVGPGEAERLAAAGHVVMYCPRAHRFFGHAPHPYRALLAAGVTVAIATDSAASNENLAVLEELRFLAGTMAPPLPAERLFRMATLDAAQALGLADQIGSLEAGKQADLAAFALQVKADPVAELIAAAPPAERVWIAGREIPSPGTAPGGGPRRTENGIRS